MVDKKGTSVIDGFRKKSRRELLASVTTLGALSTLSGCIESGNEPESSVDRPESSSEIDQRQDPFFHRFEIDDLKCQVGLDREALGEDDRGEVTTLALVHNGENIVEERFHNQESQEFELIDRGGRGHYTYGDVKIEAQNDFGDVFAEYEFTFKPELQITQLDWDSPKHEPRDDPSRYDTRSPEGSWGIFEGTVAIKNSGNAPVFLDSGYTDADPMRGLVNLASDTVYTDSVDNPPIIYPNSTTKLSVGFDNSEIIENGDERVHNCGTKVNSSLVLNFEGDFIFEAPLQIKLSGAKHIQYNTSIGDDRTYCENTELIHQRD